MSLTCFQCGKTVHESEVVYPNTDFDPFHPSCVELHEYARERFMRTAAQSPRETKLFLLGTLGLGLADVAIDN